MDERPEACPACRGTVLIRSGHACPAALEVQGPERLERCGVRLFCTDDDAPYDEALPVGRHDIGKDQTQHSGSNNSRQRRWWPASGGGRAWSSARSRWSTPPWRCSPLSLQRRQLHASASRVKPSLASLALLPHIEFLGVLKPAAVLAKPRSAISLT